MLLMDMGHSEEALAAVAEALQTIEAGAPERGHYIADLRVWLGGLRLASGASRAAEPDLRAALAYRQAELPGDHPSVAEARCLLGVALSAQDRRAEADPLLREACPVYTKWGLARRSLVALAEQALDLE
jgi:hypothetical protein